MPNEKAVEKKKLEKVANGNVSISKPGFFKRMADSFMADNGKNFKDYILYDILIPGLKETVSTTLVNAIRIIFGGKPGNKNTYNVFSTNYNIPYYKMSSTTVNQKPSVLNYTNAKELAVVEFDDRWDAEDVLEALSSTIGEYGVVSVGDYYDACGVSAGDFTDFDYGWYSLATARIVMNGNKWRISLPPAKKLEK